MARLAGDLPRFRVNIQQKIADIRGASRGGSVEQVQETVNEIQKQIAGPEAPSGNAREPVIVQSQQVSSLTDLPSWLGPAVGPLSAAGFVITLVIFMLLEREELRGRVIGLVGSGHLAVTTKAFDEAASRVSRQLLMQTLVNITYGVAIGTGLWIIGVPYALVWAALGAALRFVPYLGPVAAAVGPILVALAALPGWTRPLSVVGLLVGVELFTNLVLETVLYAGAAGVSQVALLVAVAAWTWLWGSMGLLPATPLTVCLVVLGKHVPGLEFLSTLMADSPDVSYYQRLLARDQSDAAELVQRHMASQSIETVYDALLLPALTYAERDRAEGRLSEAEEQTVIEATAELLSDVDELRGALRASAAVVKGDVDSPATDEAVPQPAVEVIAHAANGDADASALRMLAQLVEEDGIRLEVPSARMLSGKSSIWFKCARPISSASPIYRRARRRERGTSSASCAPRCRTSRYWSAVGLHRKWSTTIAQCSSKPARRMSPRPCSKRETSCGPSRPTSVSARNLRLAAALTGTTRVPGLPRVRRGQCPPDRRDRQSV
jgi:predicted PurR-regulated permease PerM